MQRCCNCSNHSLKQGRKWPFISKLQPLLMQIFEAKHGTQCQTYILDDYIKKRDLYKKGK